MERVHECGSRHECMEGRLTSMNRQKHLFTERENVESREEVSRRNRTLPK